MMASERPYWTLVEAAAWVTFRDIQVVELFSQARQGDWSAFIAYPGERTQYEEVGKQLELFDVLRAGGLLAYGRPAAQEGQLQPIPQIDWHDLVPDVDGPYRRAVSGTKIEPWVGICLKRADVERQWRRESEVEGRSRHNKNQFREQFQTLRHQKPNLSKNELIEELQENYENETGREAPSRTSILRYVKGL